MSTELQQARYDQLLRRVGDLKGPGSKVSEVLTELFPVISVEDVPLELMVLQGWRAAMISVGRTAAVAQVVATNLFNPVGSGVIAVVERILWRNTVSDTIEFDIVQNTLTGGQTKGLFRDSRLGGDRLSTLFATSQTGVGTDAILGIFTVGDVESELADRNGLFVLSPGNGVQVGQAATTNETLVVNYLWRERTAEPSELSF